MKFQVFIIVSLAKLLLVLGEDGTDSGILSLVNLGYVDGKNYFYDNTERSWDNSRAFCLQSGMQLATIETATQAAFLKSKYLSSGFDGFYWTGARDAHIPRQFTWDGTGTIPTELIGLTWILNYPSLPHYTCAMYQPQYARMIMDTSAYLGFVLCQT